MQRWLSILLAVVLGGFPLFNAHALTRESQPGYDAGPSLRKVVVVVGITMDTFQGDQEDPLSLHKYLYCQANPINHLDPTGHDGEGGVTGELGAITVQQIVVVAVLSGIAGAVYYVAHDPTDSLMKNIPLVDIQAELNQQGQIINALDQIVSSDGKRTLESVGLQSGGRMSVTVDETQPGQKIRNIWENWRNHSGYASAAEEASARLRAAQGQNHLLNVANIDAMDSDRREIVAEALEVREGAYFKWLSQYNK